MINKSKRSQVTIFVMIAIFIVVSIAVVFILRGPSEGVLPPAENPAVYMEKCMRDSLEKTLDDIEPAGGLPNAEKRQLFNGTEVAALCYTGEYEKLCTNKHPALSREIEKQIEEIMTPDIKKCFDSIKSSLSRYDYKEENSTFTLEIKISPEKVSASAGKKISYTKNEQTLNIDRFETSALSPLFQFSRITNRILNEELNCNCPIESCQANLPKISLDNPEFEVDKSTAEEGVEIYHVKEILSGKKFNFAIRNCIWRPVGYTGGF